jgi:hypothetical protein
MKTGILAAIILALSSCADYLNVAPDNALTLEELFLTRESARDGLARVYNGLPMISNSYNSEFGLGDESVARLDYNDMEANYRPHRIMRGLQSVSAPLLGLWSGTGGAKNLYVAINQCEIFMHYADGIQNMGELEIREWKAQVKFLKAYFLWLLVQHYGPIVIPPAQPADPQATGQRLFLPRTKVEDCFTHIIQLMDEAIPDLNERTATNDLGQVDQIAATAIKARVLLFRASPFFNGNREYYGDFYDHDGQPFFPQEYNREKWKDAIDAIDDAIAVAHANGKRLYTYTKEPYLYDREDMAANPQNLKLLYDNRMIVCDPWNEELLWGFSGVDYYNQGDLSTAANMRLPAGYENTESVNNNNFSWQELSSTYASLERYYTKNGLPLDEDLTFDATKKHEVVVTPGIEDPAYQPLRGIFQPGAETLHMYLDREPRFYANMVITGGYWRAHLVRIRTMMYAGSDGGRTTTSFPNNYYCTGIAFKKFVHPENKSNGWPLITKCPYPLIRLADLYLMKAEALNEYNESPTQEVYEMINQVRRRAGIPDVQTVWANPALTKSVNRHLTQEGMREIILQERANEFAFEGSRFWDMHRHKRAVREFSGPAMGWTPLGATAQTFFVLEAWQNRKFTVTDCLWPIDLNETNTNGNLIQNPGW